jgi:hypothetical protein
MRKLLFARIAYIARTSRGQKHHNTLVLRPQFPYSI